MRNKVQDIVPLQITNITVPDASEESKAQRIKLMRGNGTHRQSVPVISIISGSNDGEEQRDSYLQGI